MIGFLRRFNLHLTFRAAYCAPARRQFLAPRKHHFSRGPRNQRLSVKSHKLQITQLSHYPERWIITAAPLGTCRVGATCRSHRHVPVITAPDQVAIGLADAGCAPGCCGGHVAKPAIPLLWHGCSGTGPRLPSALSLWPRLSVDREHTPPSGHVFSVRLWAPG